MNGAETVQTWSADYPERQLGEPWCGPRVPKKHCRAMIFWSHGLPTAARTAQLIIIRAVGRTVQAVFEHLITILTVVALRALIGA